MTRFTVKMTAECQTERGVGFPVQEICARKLPRRVSAQSVEWFSHAAQPREIIWFDFNATAADVVTKFDEFLGSCDRRSQQYGVNMVKRFV